MRYRVVILCGPKLWHKNTCATLIREGINVVGICMADERAAGLPISYLSRSVQRKGLWMTLSRTLARTMYLVRNYRKDKTISSRLFNVAAIDATLTSWPGDILETESYTELSTMEWLRQRKPDVLVVHSPYWIGKRVRQLAKSGIVIGGHPGLTPFYRGSHSAFWAVYRRRPQDIGCTVFLLNEQVDGGAILAQERISIEPGDSFVTLGWKGMIRIAEIQARILRELDAGADLLLRKISPPAHSEFDNPTLFQLLQYWCRQSQVR
jgi:methionyl-tRNA formyltransferase